MWQPMLRQWGAVLPSLRWIIYKSYSEFLCMWEICLFYPPHSFIHSFIQSFIYIMGIHFILCVIINTANFFAQIIPVLATGSSFSCLLCLFDIPPSMLLLLVFFALFYFFCHYRMLQVHLVYFPLHSLNQPFLQGSLVSFIEE